MKILVGIPTAGYIDNKILSGFFHSLMYFHKYYSRSTIQIKIVEREVIHTARQQILIYAYRNRFDYLLFLDDDMLLSKRTVIKLFQANLDAVTALYFARQPPYSPLLYRLKPNKKYEMMLPNWEERYNKVGGTSLGCTLLSRKAIEVSAYKPLWNSLYSTGEDATFWLILKDNNIDCVVDISNEVGHCTKQINTINREAYNKFMES